MCSLVLYGALDIGDIRDKLHIRNWFFPGVGVGKKEKQKNQL